MTMNPAALPESRPTEIVRTIHGHELRAFSGDYITRRIKRRGIYEPLPLSLVAELLRKRPGSVVLDVGANIGNHALSFALDAGRVFSFEPIGEVFELLRENIERNGLSTVQCFNLGFSEANATATIYVTQGENIGSSSLERNAEGSVPQPITLVRGDDWLRGQADEIGRIDLIKLDVEGHEPSALLGLKDSIARFRPVVMLEYNDDPTVKAFNDRNVFKTCFADYDFFVLGNNYDEAFYEGAPLAGLRRFLARNFRKKAVRLYPFDPARRYHNILLVPREQRDELLRGFV